MVHKNHQGKSQKFNQYTAFQKNLTWHPFALYTLEFSGYLHFQTAMEYHKNRPRTIIAGQILDYNQHCALEFGRYIQLEHDNGMSEITTEALHCAKQEAAKLGNTFIALKLAGY